VTAAALVPAPPQTLSKERRLGASSMAAAIGLSPWRRPIDVWLELTGRAAPFDGNEATRWGTALEPIIRAHYVELNKVAVHVPPETLFHRELPFVSCTPDGIVIADDGKWLRVGPQVKNIGLRQAARWADGEVPIEYQVQAAVELAVTLLSQLDFAVLIGGSHYEQPTVHRDLDIEADILTEACAFWRLVETDTQPPVDGSKAFRDYLLGKIQRRGLVVAATPADVASMERWREIVQARAELDEEEELLKNLLLSRLVAEGGERLRAPGVGDMTVSAPGKSIKWKEVCYQLARLVPADVFADAVDAHTDESKPKINRPRSWSAKED
jgi:putative phage-type endonuclease